MNQPKSRTLLAIESSCDETAIAILRGFNELLISNITSQANIHASYGGVVPEVASRNHLADLPPMIPHALQCANLTIHDIDAFAATVGPGLAPALLVGLSHAKGLAIGMNRPFFAINHIEGHLLSPFFGYSTIPEHIGLIVSGGHTLLVHVKSFGDYTVAGKSIDDAAGEAFDKVAKLLNMPYPGGALLDELAEKGNPKAFDLPRSMLHSKDSNFSFSGLKTAVRYLLEKHPIETAEAKANLCASFREAVVDILVAKSLELMQKKNLRILGVSGGVATNVRLRQRLLEESLRIGFEIHFAPEGMRMDNAAMIAYVAAHRLASSKSYLCPHTCKSELDDDIQPRLDWKKFS